MTLAGYNLQDNVYIYSNNKCMCVFLISPVPIAEPLTSELIDTPVFYNLAPRPIKYRVSVPIPTVDTDEARSRLGSDSGNTTGTGTPAFGPTVETRLISPGGLLHFLLLLTVRKRS